MAYLEYQTDTEKNNKERNFVIELIQYSYDENTGTKSEIRRKYITGFKCSLIFTEYYLDHYCFMSSVEYAQRDEYKEHIIETCYEFTVMPGLMDDVLTIHHIASDYPTEELEAQIGKMAVTYAHGYGKTFYNNDYN